MPRKNGYQYSPATLLIRSDISDVHFSGPVFPSLKFQAADQKRSPESSGAPRVHQEKNRKEGDLTSRHGSHR